MTAGNYTESPVVHAAPVIPPVGCNNCAFHGFPCHNCAFYVFHGSMGPGFESHRRTMMVDSVDMDNVGEDVIARMWEWIDQHPEIPVYFTYQIDENDDV